jgi:predicted AlkP superfamily pyrophosphatase or phosphodiesterase
MLLHTVFAVVRSAEAADFPRRPKLVVIVVIDQFRYDYLVRFRQQFVERGFNLLLNGGANFIDCRYDYASTSTGPGHASLFTGAYSDIHGIVENRWYDRTLHRPIYCVDDPEARTVDGPEGSGAGPGVSPRNLMGSTIGDELRAATDFQSRVITISLKDRAAVLMGGHTANAAYWFDPRAGHFVTSTYYMPALPAWVGQFNDRNPAKAYCGKSWQPLPETPGGAGTVFKEPASSPNEPCPNRSFLTWMAGTPFMNEVELDFAREAIKGERLGQESTTDLLAISLSVNDNIGHTFGPYSPEVADATLQTDRYLAAFFATLDKLVGLNNVWIAFSADHGVAPNPRFVREHNLGLGLFRPEAVEASVQRALSQSFGEDRWVDLSEGASLYLNLTALQKHGVDRARAEAVAAEAALAVPGVEVAFTRSQLLTGSLPNTPLGRKAVRSFYAQRSGDVFLIVSPYAIASSNESATTHGTPWSYDAQVPLILWGSAFKPGVYATPTQPIDLAATLAAVLGLTQPSGAEGKPLIQAIKQESTASHAWPQETHPLR